MTTRSVYAGDEADSEPLSPTQEHLAAQPPETKGYLFNHIMYRIKDPKVSLPFYEEVLGLRSIMKLNTGPFTIYYLSYPEDRETPESRLKNMQVDQSLIELIHMHGTEDVPDFSYTSGNEAGNLGFGHLGWSVPDVPAAMERFKSLGVDIIKSPGETDPKCLTLPSNNYLPGSSFVNDVFSKIGYIRDPDGYWIEIIPKGGFA